MEVEGEVNAELGRCLSKLIDDGTIESHRYYLARRTALEMLKDRGYAVPNSEIELSLHDFRNSYGPIPDPDRLRILAALRSDPSKKILVVFCGPQLVKVSVMRGIVAQIANKESLNGMILILQNKITNQAQKCVDILPFKVEFFQITDLLVNVTKHVLKPKHQVLNEREKQKLLKKFNVEEKQLPRMLVNDAIAKYYGLQKGQVVKVTYSARLPKRMSPTGVFGSPGGRIAD